MKQSTFLLFFCFCILNVSALRAQDDAAMMKAWMDFMTPGAMHKWMAESDGTWDGEVNTYMDPNNPTKSTATVTNKMIYNGLYQMGDYSGNMMGQPFQGHSILAYDNAKQKFVNTWIDNMGSGVIILYGDYDAATQTLHLKGTQTDPMTKKDSAIRQKVKFVDKNTQTFTMYGPGRDGKETKMMDIKLTRKM